MGIELEKELDEGVVANQPLRDKHCILVQVQEIYMQERCSYLLYMSSTPLER